MLVYFKNNQAIKDLKYLIRFPKMNDKFFSRNIVATKILTMKEINEILLYKLDRCKRSTQFDSCSRGNGNSVELFPINNLPTGFC